jgi:ribosomal 30S subunit maturation factor RimM
MAQTEIFRGHIGDLVVIEGHRVGQGRRLGEVLEVFGEPSHEHYRVRWEDGHETVFYPSNDATIQHVEQEKKRKE